MDEKTFYFNIDNIKNDLAMEGMSISEDDVNLFKRYANEEIDMSQLIEIIKNKPIEE